MEPPGKMSETSGRAFRTVAEVEASLPAPWHEDERVLQLRCQTLAARANGLAPLAVIDDDPTGTQTVHSIPVLADWTVPNLTPIMTMDRPCFYVLANTRALAPAEAAARAEEIGRNLRLAASKAGVGPLTAVVSRGDSTLRGHYPAETDALARGLGWGGAGSEAEAPVIVLAPFFKEGGRLTAHDVHYVAGQPGSGGDGSAELTPAGETLRATTLVTTTTMPPTTSPPMGPCGLTDADLSPWQETEFARDRAFGYKESYLPAWIAEKHGGSSPVPSIAPITLDVVRRRGPDAVAELVTSAPGGSVLVANAVTARDMQVIALGCLKAELARGAGRPLLYRSAGALVAARAAIPPRPLLEASEVAAPGAMAPPRAAGLVVVGSYVGKSSDQLATLLGSCPWLAAVELAVAAFVAGDASSASSEIERAHGAVHAALAKGESPVLYTSRKVMQDDGAGGLHIGSRVNDAICTIVERIMGGAARPGFIVAKGGITSNDIAVRSLGVRSAEVMGAIVPGVPVWRCGPESRAPGLAYVVFPGNVGAKDDLARVAYRMSGRELPESMAQP